MRRFLLALSCCAIPVLSQHLTIGAKGGLRLTGDVPMYRTSNSRRYVVGPMIELGLPYHFAFEVDALYSRLGNTFRARFIGLGGDTRTIANSWEFPLLVKYRLPVSRVNPFLSIGVAPRYAGGRINTIRYGFLPGDITFSSEDWHAHDRALVFSSGIGIPTGRIYIAPEIRYLKWKVPRSPSSNDVAFYLQPPRNDELRILLGIGLRM
jgi:hypothetical protein